MDSSDQIQIRIFKIHNLSVFWERIWKKKIWQNKRNKNGTQQIPYMYQMYDIPTEPLLLVVAPDSELLVTYHLMFVIGLVTNTRIF